MPKEILKKLTAPDERNERITLELLYNELNKIPLSNRIPEDVANMIELSKKLCLYSYFEYDFYSVSTFFSCLAVEAALKVKLGKKQGCISELSKLALEQKLLPSRVEFLFEPLRRLRNSYAHPKFKTVITPEMAVVSVLRIVDLVNCLFDPSAWEREPDILTQQRIEYERIMKEIKNHKK